MSCAMSETLYGLSSQSISVTRSNSSHSKTLMVSNLTEPIESDRHFKRVDLWVSEVPASWHLRPALTLPRHGSLSSHVAGKMVSQRLFSQPYNNLFQTNQLTICWWFLFLSSLNHLPFPKFAVPQK